MKNETLYFYECLEAAKYRRSGYTWNTSRKNVLDDIKGNYVHPTMIRITIIKEESEEYVQQIQKMKERVS